MFGQFALLNNFERKHFPSSKIAFMALAFAFIMPGVSAAGALSDWKENTARHSDMAPKYEANSIVGHGFRHVKNVLKFVINSYTGLIFIVCMTLGFLAMYGDFGTWFNDPKLGNDVFGDQGASMWARLAVIIPCFVFALGSTGFAVFRYYQLQDVQYSKVEYKYEWKLKNDVKGFGTTTDLKHSLHLFFVCMIFLSIAMIISGHKNHDNKMFWIATGLLGGGSIMGIIALFRSSPNMKLTWRSLVPFLSKTGPLISAKQLECSASLDQQLRMQDYDSNQTYTSIKTDGIHSESTAEEKTENDQMAPKRESSIFGGSNERSDMLSSVPLPEDTNNNTEAQDGEPKLRNKVSNLSDRLSFDPTDAATTNEFGVRKVFSKEKRRRLVSLERLIANTL